MEFLLSLDHTESLRFGEAGDATSLEWFCHFLEQMEPHVRFEETFTEPDNREPDNSTMPNASDGVIISPESVEIHRRVTRFMEKNPEVSYTEALSKICTSLEI